MIIHIDPHSGVAIYRQIIEQVKRQIMTGVVADGTKMPSIRDVAKDIKVNPMTVSKAFGLLEREGLLERQRGVGLFAKSEAGGEDAKVKRQLLEKMIKKAAVATVQMGVSFNDVLEMFIDEYQRVKNVQIDIETNNWFDNEIDRVKKSK